MNLAILGPGLLGGSIALAARRLGQFRVSLWARRAEAVEEASRLGIADVVSGDLRTVVERADLIVLCVPIGAMRALAEEVVKWIPPHVVVTDVGSVKASVVAELAPIFAQRGHFIGSHPMAGSERTGIQAARADLFEGAVCIVTPEVSSDAAVVSVVHEFWQKLGCRVREISPAMHDEVVALISHFPHLLAATLVETVAAVNPAAFEFAGPGFRDCTRIAGGPPAMWAEILRTNHAAVRHSAEAMIEKLREIITLLERDAPMTDFLTQAKTQRDALRLPK